MTGLLVSCGQVSPAAAYGDFAGCILCLRHRATRPSIILYSLERRTLMHLIRNLQRKSRQTHSSRPAKARSLWNYLGRHRLGYEPLEDRRLLSVTPLTMQQESELTQGLQQLAQWSTQLNSYGALGQQLPLFGESVSQVANLANAVEGFYSQLSTTLPGNATHQQVLTALSSISTTVDNLQISVSSVTDVSTASELAFSVDLHGQETLATSINLNSLINSSQISFPNSPTANLEGNVDFTFTFGLNLPSSTPATDAFFIQPGNLTAAVSAQLNNVNVAAQVGVLGVQVQNGSFSLNAGLSATFPASSQNGGDQLTLSTLQNDVSANSVQLTPTNDSLMANLPVTATLGGWTASGNPTIAVTSSSVFASTPPTVSFNGFGQLFNFDRLTPTDVVTVLQGLASGLQTVNSGPTILATTSTGEWTTYRK